MTFTTTEEKKNKKSLFATCHIKQLKILLKFLQFSYLLKHLLKIYCKMTNDFSKKHFPKELKETEQITGIRVS